MIEPSFIRTFQSKLHERAGECLRFAKAAGAVEEQKHLDEGSEARTYWHYGYGMAILDILAGVERGEDITLPADMPSGGEPAS